MGLGCILPYLGRKEDPYNFPACWLHLLLRHCLASPQPLLPNFPSLPHYHTPAPFPPFLPLTLACLRHLCGRHYPPQPTTCLPAALQQTNYPYYHCLKLFPTPCLPALPYHHHFTFGLFCFSYHPAAVVGHFWDRACLPYLPALHFAGSLPTHACHPRPAAFYSPFISALPYFLLPAGTWRDLYPILPVTFRQEGGLGRLGVLCACHEQAGMLAWSQPDIPLPPHHLLPPRHICGALCLFWAGHTDFLPTACMSHVTLNMPPMFSMTPSAWTFPTQPSQICPADRTALPHYSYTAEPHLF